MNADVRMLVVENFGSCNMRCTYCFPEHMWQRQGHKGAMTEETYRGIVERMFSTTTSEQVDIHFAGGEPLAAGLPWLQMGIGTAREVAANHGKQVSFSLQTNATLLTPEIARYLVANDVTVGISLDGPPELNEAVRGNTERTLQGFQILSDARGRRPGIIVTVTRCNATRMPEVVSYLDRLGVAMFRANQMGATASWNVHAAPRAGEWATARRDIFEEIVARRGRMMEFNLSRTILKFVRSLIEGRSSFDVEAGCCALRCPAGRQLMYFDQRGHAYPCPRSNVTADTRIGHFADADFDARWDETLIRLDQAMVAPPACRQCPAQVACDYGCHAFNTAQGNFFEVNCDATKEYFQFLTSRLEDVAWIYFALLWRDRLKAADDYAALQMGIEVPGNLVADLAEALRQRLAEHAARPDLDLAVLERRYGWHDEFVPLASLNRPRVGAVSGEAEGRGRLPVGGGAR
jgi:uncharacterized protein